MRRGSGVLFTLTMVLIGSLVGSLIGVVLAQWFPVAGQSVAAIGLNNPVTLDLKVFTFTVGATLRLNLMGLVGLLVGLIYGLRH